MLFSPQNRLLDILIRMIFYGEKPEKATDKEIRLRMSILSLTSLFVLFAFHFMALLRRIFDLDRINLFLPLLVCLIPCIILYLILYCIPARISIVLGIVLMVWVIVEIAYRTIHV